MRRLYRFVKWYRALRQLDFQFPRRVALDIAWYWSSDEAAFVRAGGR